MARPSHFYCVPQKLDRDAELEEKFQARRGINGLASRDTDTREMPLPVARHAFFGQESTLKRNLKIIIRRFRGDALSKVINESRRILDLQPGWDGEGAPGYSEETWKRAVGFLMASNEWMNQHLALAMPIPAIKPGPDGGIDIHWKESKFELLMTFHSEADEPVSYYGDDRANDAVKGTLDPKHPEFGLILRWLDKTRR